MAQAKTKDPHGQSAAAFADVIGRKRTESLWTAERRVLELIAEGTPLPTALEVLARAIEEQSSGMLVSILLLDSDGTRLRHGAAPSLPESYRRAIDGIAIGPSAGSCGTAIFRGEAVIVPDVANDPLWADFRDLALSHGLRACWSTPILGSGGQALGTFALYYRRPRSPGPEDLQLIEFSAHVTRIAIERHRTEEERAQLLARERAARAEAEAAARQLLLYREIIANSSEAVAIISPQGEYREQNAAHRALIGYSDEELVGQTPAIHLRQPPFSAIAGELARRGRFDGEVICETKHGARIEIELAAFAIRDARGDPVCYVGIKRDITGRKLLERELRQQAEELAAADRRKDDFLAVLAHELRNPLAPVRNAVEILKRLNVPEPRLTRVREIIERQVSHQARLLDDLLDVSRITRGKIALRWEQIDLARLVRDTVEDCGSVLEAAGLSLSLTLPDTPVWVEGDPTRLAQVLGNLLHNAAKFTDRGGHVTVRLAVADPSPGLTPPPGIDPSPQPPPRSGEGEPASDASSSERGRPSRSQAPLPVSGRGRGRGYSPGGGQGGRVPPSFATLAVQDTGIGIEPEVLPHVFEPFAQADRSLERTRGGLGLGLALVKGLVELHGGEAQAASEGAGRGATLTLRLPLAPTETAPEQAAPAATAGPLRILIVEDNRDAAESLCELLELSGCTVAVAFSGPEGLAAAEQFRPEVVLCDLGLPGMDGYQVAENLRRSPHLGRPRLIALSGYGQEEDHRRSREAGFDLHLTKPVEFEQLQRLLDTR